MTSGPVRLLLAACSTLTLMACGSTAAPAARTGTAATHAPDGPHGTPAPGACGTPPPRHAWAVEVSRTGQVLWRTPLETRDNASSLGVPPVPVGPVAVFAQDGVVHGIRLADGHALWSWPGGQSVDGMWRWGGLVVVNTDQVTSHGRLTGLDAATGAVRWSLRLPARGLLGGQVLTAGGGLAMAVPGQGLQVVSLADGRVRWRRRIAASPALAAVGGLVLYGRSGRLAGYDARTGALRWTASPKGVSPDPAFQLADGLLVISSFSSGPSVPNTITAVVPATGRVAWRFDPPTPAADPEAQASVLSAGPAGLAVATYDPRRLYLLDQRTGQPRWHAATFVELGRIPLITAASVIGVEGPGPDAVVARDAASGRIRWRASLGGLTSGNQPVLAAGPLALLQDDPGAPGPAPLRAYQAASGRLVWQAVMPLFVEAPPVLVPGGILLQPADPASGCAAAFTTGAFTTGAVTTGAVTTDAGRRTADPA